MAPCSKDFLRGDDFDAVLAIFRSYRYGENASEAVEEIVIDEKDYRKCSFCVTVCIAMSRVEIEKIVYLEHIQHSQKDFRIHSKISSGKAAVSGP